MAHLRQASAAAAALWAACAPPGRWIDRALAPGDTIIAVVDADDPERAQAMRVVADARGAVTLSITDGTPTLIAQLRHGEMVDERGAPVDLARLTVDLAGDRDAPCGCSAPAIDQRQRVRAGDRCALPPWVALEPLDGTTVTPEVTAAIRERLRLSWPGACAARAPEVVEGTLTVCPLGEGARGHEPVRAAVGRDGTIALVSRGFVTELTPDGARYDARLPSALRYVIDAQSFGARGTLVVSDVAGTLAEPRSQLVWIPGRGRAAPRALAGVPPEASVTGTLRSPGADSLSLYGAASVAGGSVGALWNCQLDDDAVACARHVLRPAPGCPSFGWGAVTSATRLGDGTALGIARDGQIFVVEGDEARCVPERDAAPFSSMDGEPVDVGGAGPLVAVGRTALACVVGRVHGQSIAVAVTATIAADAGAGVRWTTVTEATGGIAFCGLAFVDERTGARAVLEIGAGNGARTVELRRDGGRARAMVTPRAALFPEVPAWVTTVASSTAGLAAITEPGEVWSATAATSALTPRWTLSPAGFVRAGAVMASGDGFRVSGAGGARVQVSVPRGPTCAGIAVTADPAAYRDVEGAEHDDVLLSLGGRTVAGGHRGDQVWLRLEDPDERVALPGSARVVSAAEVIEGDVMALVRDDGSLWASDGRAAWPLHDGQDAPWRGISAAGGVAWVFGDAALGRLLPAQGNLHFERDAWASIDRRAFDALPRARPPVLAQVAALPSGGALVAFHEALDRILQGDIDDTTVWCLTSAPSALTLSPYPLDPRGARPLFPQRVVAIVGGPETPLLVFAGTNHSAGLHVPGGPALALPFSTVLGVARHGDDVLVVGPDLRMAVVRVRR